MQLRNLPVPPSQESIHLFLFRGVLQDLNKTVVESLGVCDQIRTGKHRGRAERKTNLSSEVKC